MVVVHFNSDSTNARFESGFYWFYSYCMASMVMSVILDSMFRTVVAAEENESGKSVSFAKYDHENPRRRPSKQAQGQTWRDTFSTAITGIVPFLGFAETD